MQAPGAMITSAQKFLRERPRQTLRGLTNIHLWNRGEKKGAIHHEQHLPKQKIKFLLYKVERDPKYLQCSLTSAHNRSGTAF